VGMVSKERMVKAGPRVSPASPWARATPPGRAKMKKKKIIYIYIYIYQYSLKKIIIDNRNFIY
jgi:hypothetical protein